jgi:hypothetical protein
MKMQCTKGISSQLLTTFGVKTAFIESHDKTTAICKYSPKHMRLVEEDATKAFLQGKPGTEALMDLLANLLSPGIRPGLTTDDTTIRALAVSIDNVRTRLYQQVSPENLEKLQNYLEYVRDCVDRRTPEAEKKKWSYGELAATCRNTKHSVDTRKLLALLRAGRGTSLYDANDAVIFATLNDIDSASSVDYSLALSKQAPTFPLQPAVRTFVLRGRMKNAPERYTDDDDLFLDAFARGEGNNPPKLVMNRPLLRNGNKFKRLKGDTVEHELQAQASLCTDFIKTNGDAVSNRVSDSCGPAADSQRCYCFAVRSSKRRIKIVRVLAGPKTQKNLEDFAKAARDLIAKPKVQQK